MGEHCPGCGSASIGCLDCSPGVMRSQIELKRAIRDLEAAQKRMTELESSLKTAEAKLQSLDIDARKVADSMQGATSEILPKATEMGRVFKLLNELKSFLQDHFGVGYSRT